MGRLDSLDLSLSLSKAEEAKRIEAGQERLTRLRLALGGKLQGYETRLGPPICVLLEGWDAAGKGGALKRLVQPLDPRHVRVVAYGAPTPDEKRHHFLWRFWPALPGAGGMAVLDRTWYGRVLVEKVEGFATPAEVERGYVAIVEHERSLCAEGTVLTKLWLHISDEEQLRRFRKREKDPLKQWKITEDDWRNRARRGDYLDSVEIMLERTDHELAPWHLVEADSKPYARVKVLETVIAEIERGMKAQEFPVP